MTEEQCLIPTLEPQKTSRMTFAWPKASRLSTFFLTEELICAYKRLVKKHLENKDGGEA